MNHSFLDTFQIRRDDVVSVVGSGGKATLMYHLGHEALSRGYTVLTTSSTHLHPPTPRQSNGLIIISEEPDWTDTLPVLFSTRRHMTIVGSSPRPDKLRGLDLETLSKLRKVCPADLLLIKADGARTREFKAPGDHEPVVPSWTTHGVIVVGLNCVGLPLDEQYVHRPERVAALSGLRFGAPLTVEAIARVVSHPDSYTRTFPSGVRIILYLGWCSDPGRRQAAQAICDATDPRIIPQVCYGNIEEDEANISILR